MSADRATASNAHDVPVLPLACGSARRRCWLALTRKNTDTHDELQLALFSSNDWSEESRQVTSTRAGGRSGGSRPAGASIVARVLHQPPTRFDKALLEADQRPRVDPLREHQPPPEIPEVIGEHAQLQPDPTVAALRRRERN